MEYWPHHSRPSTWADHQLGEMTQATPVNHQGVWTFHSSAGEASTGDFQSIWPSVWGKWCILWCLRVWNLRNVWFCWGLPSTTEKNTIFFNLLFRATPATYGSSLARSRIGASAARLYHSHSNSGSLTH